MPSSFTTTYTASFTRTHARYLASKVAADMRQMNMFYGKPEFQMIEDYITELTELLVGGYLSSVDYGFQRNGNWVVALNYVVRSDGTLDTDDRAGRVPFGVDVTGAYWGSYLRTNTAWSALSQTEREQVQRLIPINRPSAPEPGVESGIWIEDKRYYSTGTALSRRTFKPL